MYTVLTDFFATRAARFKSEKPAPQACRSMVQDAIIVLRAYDESIGELLDQQRSIARHDALPGDGIHRNTRGDQISW